MKLTEFKCGMEVAYVPPHVQQRYGQDWQQQVEFELKTHPIIIDSFKRKWHGDAEIGVVSSVNDQFVFVRYWPKLAEAGWEGTTSVATKPDDLIILNLLSDFQIPESV